jgi:hypothetical protein
MRSGRIYQAKLALENKFNQGGQIKRLAQFTA